MDIIRIFNGLGNQMSQYAFYLAKKKRNPWRTRWVYFQDKYGNVVHNGFELDRLFGISSNKMVDNFFIKFFFVFKFTRDVPFARFIRENIAYDYDPELLKSGKHFCLTYYEGGWHSEKYFRDIRTTLLKVFRFPEEMLSEKTKEWVYKIKTLNNACSVHVRRGDFLNGDLWTGIATDEYYKSAMQIMKNQYRVNYFFVFSNDIKWCEEHWGNDGIYYVDCNKKEDSWQDMYLMSQCKYHINANSTFSWWGAWLCDISGSKTIVPHKFYNIHETKDLYPHDWIKIDSLGNIVSYNGSE